MSHIRLAPAPASGSVHVCPRVLRQNLIPLPGRALLYTRVIYLSSVVCTSCIRLVAQAQPSSPSIYNTLNKRPPRLIFVKMLIASSVQRLHTLRVISEADHSRLCQLYARLCHRISKVLGSERIRQDNIGVYRLLYQLYGRYARDNSKQKYKHVGEGTKWACE